MLKGLMLAAPAADLAAIPDRPSSEAPTTPSADELPIAGVELGIAYGTEKRKWLEWTLQQFRDTEAGKNIRITLIPMGSLEAARAILAEDKRIHVWSPASSLYRETFQRDWRARFRGDPVLKEERLALTPMVIVMWKERYDAYVATCPEVSLRTIRFAMTSRTGWARIANKPEWGLFKFAHTHPNQSNSGLMTLVVLAYEFHRKNAGLTTSDVMSRGFQNHLELFERGVTGLSHSTGTLMKEMIAKGPSGCDAVMVYESVAIDYLREAESAGGPLQVVYPRFNLWSDHPYYILNTPWTTKAHQAAAETFLRFLMSEPIQSRALDHGFRPGNPAVPVIGPNSPFTLFAANGLAVDVPEICQPPRAEIIECVLQSWLRNAVPR